MTLPGAVVHFATYHGKKYPFIIDEEDAVRVDTRSWHVTEKGYIRAHNEYLHRFIMGGSAPEYDHKNKNKFDNRKENLKPCTHSENMQNKGEYRNNTSGHKGVCWATKKGKWRAFINTGGQIRTIGHFDNFYDAVNARLAAERIVK